MRLLIEFLLIKMELFILHLRHHAFLHKLLNSLYTSLICVSHARLDLFLRLPFTKLMEAYGSYWCRVACFILFNCALN